MECQKKSYTLLLCLIATCQECCCRCNGAITFRDVTLLITMQTAYTNELKIIKIFCLLLEIKKKNKSCLVLPYILQFLN